MSETIIKTTLEDLQKLINKNTEHVLARTKREAEAMIKAGVEAGIARTLIEVAAHKGYVSTNKAREIYGGPFINKLLKSHRLRPVKQGNRNMLNLNDIVRELGISDTMKAQHTPKNDKQ